MNGLLDGRGIEEKQKCEYPRSVGVYGSRTAGCVTRYMFEQVCVPKSTYVVGHFFIN